MSNNDNSTHSSSKESGSAYILVLMVLLVLTLLGLVLAFITQSEVEVGANERTVNRVFYGAEAGVTAAVTNLLIANDRSAQDLTFMDPGTPATPASWSRPPAASSLPPSVPACDW